MSPIATATPPAAQAAPVARGASAGLPDRWAGIVRPYSPEEVERLRGSLQVEHTLARQGAERLWELLHTRPFVGALGALTGGQAVQQVRAGLEAIYVSGWQVAADQNQSGATYPDQSLYPSNSVPMLVRRLNSALQRADQIERSEGKTPWLRSAADAAPLSGSPLRPRHDTSRSGAGLASAAGAEAQWWYAPIVADAEAGFGGPLHAYELMRSMIEAGAAGVHFEDQLAAEKKCGHLGGKVLTPTGHFVKTLVAARLAADVLGVPTLIVARTDAESARLLTSDVDERDRPFLTGERTSEGFFRITGGLEMAIARALAYAPYADLVWCETSHPDLGEARKFAEAVRAAHPGKLLAYNCSPSFNWRKHLDEPTIARFQRELGAMGYAFQFVTLAGFHALNASMFDLAQAYRTDGMAAYSRLQEAEFAAEARGYTATKHQREVGVGYFDLVARTVGGAEAATLAMGASTERAQF